MSHIFESKAIFNLDPTAFSVQVESHHVLELVLRSATSVGKKTIENTRKLLEETREAHRLLVARERRTNHYQHLQLRSPQV